MTARYIRDFQAYDDPKTWTKRFLRSAFSRPDRPNVVLLVYEGDETAAINFHAKLARAVSRPYDTISWVGCDFCPRWYHRVCVGKVKDTGRNPFRCESVR